MEPILFKRLVKEYPEIDRYGLREIKRDTRAIRVLQRALDKEKPKEYLASILWNLHDSSWSSGYSPALTEIFTYEIRQAGLFHAQRLIPKLQKLVQKDIYNWHITGADLTMQLCDGLTNQQLVCINSYRSGLYYRYLLRAVVLTDLNNAHYISYEDELDELRKLMSEHAFDEKHYKELAMQLATEKFVRKLVKRSIKVYRKYVKYVDTLYLQKLSSKK